MSHYERISQYCTKKKKEFLNKGRCIYRVSNIKLYLNDIRRLSLRSTL